MVEVIRMKATNMHKDKIFKSHIEKIKEEGRYRSFARLERRCGDFPHALYHPPGNVAPRDVTIWCSNDYLGMGQNPVVLNAMHDAITKFGAGAGGTRNISGTQKLHCDLEDSLADLHGKESAMLRMKARSRQSLKLWGRIQLFFPMRSTTPR